MKKFFFILIFLFFIPHTRADSSGTITLIKTAETETEISYVLEAQEIVSELIGISTTIKFPEELSFKNYQAGVFFEEESENVTYLISPNKNNSQELVIGIVTLGESSAQGNGIIVGLTFTKFTPKLNRGPQIVEAKASGIVDNKRTDYDQITWLTENSLPTTGPFSWENIFMFSLVSSVIGYCLKSLFTTTSVRRQGQCP